MEGFLGCYFFWLPIPNGYPFLNPIAIIGGRKQHAIFKIDASSPIDQIAIEGDSFPDFTRRMIVGRNAFQIPFAIWDFSFKASIFIPSTAPGIEKPGFL